MTSRRRKRRRVGGGYCGDFRLRLDYATLSLLPATALMAPVTRCGDDEDFSRHADACSWRASIFAMMPLRLTAWRRRRLRYRAFRRFSAFCRLWRNAHSECYHVASRLLSALLVSGWFWPIIASADGRLPDARWLAMPDFTRDAA